MDVAKLLSSSPTPMPKEDVYRSFEDRFKETYVNLILIACEQIRLCEKTGLDYLATQKYREQLKRADRSELSLIFRSALQEYPPFLLFTEFVTKGYTLTNATAMTRGILKIESPLSRVEKSLRNWGSYAGVFDKVTGELVLPLSVDRLTAEFVKGLHEALDSQLKANIFIIELLSPQGYAYLVEEEIDVSTLSSALLSHEKDPRTSAENASQVYEQFLYKLGQDVGANVTKANGVIELADSIRSVWKPSPAVNQKMVLANQTLISHGLGGIRNMSSHGPDKETGIKWTISPQAALAMTLLVCTTIRSINLFVHESQQEF